ncbi:uncharacterized protein LOC116249650 isoform X1 [Nymphaea colorata]|nr:uncharacterized protein LOC116249650 isoform X1 [Nymphaea colorata]
MDSWLQKARSLAEEAAKRSQELTKEAAKLSQGIASETAKRSKEFAVEATKRADLIKAEALKLPDQIKTLADGITPQIPTLSPASAPPPDLEKYGITDELREFVKGLTISTFRDFPLEDEPQASDVPTVSNVRQDLTEWQARHATLVLSTVKEISHFRYELCPRHMKERCFWRIYFTLVQSHVAPYEKAFMDEVQFRSTEQDKDVTPRANQPVTTPSNPEISESSSQRKVPTENDLDAFLLGDLGSSDEEADGDGGGFDDDDDLDSIVNASSSKRS